MKEPDVTPTQVSSTVHAQKYGVLRRRCLRMSVSEQGCTISSSTSFTRASLTPRPMLIGSCSSALVSSASFTCRGPGAPTCGAVTVGSEDRAGCHRPAAGRMLRWCLWTSRQQSRTPHRGAVEQDVPLHDVAAELAGVGRAARSAVQRHAARQPPARDVACQHIQLCSMHSHVSVHLDRCM